MEFDVRCRFCGDVELLGPRVCKPCRKTLGIGALIGGSLAAAGLPWLRDLLHLVVLALQNR